MNAGLVRLADRPFATAMASLFFISSVIQITGISLTGDALAEYVPQWLRIGLAAAYGLGGLLLLLGMAAERQDIEAAGCILVGTGVAVRLFAVVLALGFSVPVFATATFYVSIGWACGERLRQIANRERIMRISQKIVLTDASDIPPIAVVPNDGSEA